LKKTRSYLSFRDCLQDEEIRLKREGGMFYFRDCIEEYEIRPVFQGLPSR
jgi:hypothetical protein